MPLITGPELVKEYEKTFGKFTYEERDCIGSIWKILEKYGAKTDLVGSNWFARHELRNMRPLYSADQLYDGCAVLKSILPGEPGYNLPPRYKGHVDQIDYNHIGIGTSTGKIYDSTRYKNSKGEYVRNGPGISTAKISSSSWDIIADFEDVNGSDPGVIILPGEENHIMETMRVYAEKGSTVNLRSFPSIKDNNVIAMVPIGTEVIVLEAGAKWTKVRFGHMDGWMLNEFLVVVGESPDADPVSAPVDLDRTALLNELEGLINRQSVIISLLKGGI
jgi:hypothetical protein